MDDTRRPPPEPVRATSRQTVRSASSLTAPLTVQVMDEQQVRGRWTWNLRHEPGTLDWGDGRVSLASDAQRVRGRLLGAAVVGEHLPWGAIGTVYGVLISVAFVLLWSAPDSAALVLLNFLGFPILLLRQRQLRVDLMDDDGVPHVLYLSKLPVSRHRRPMEELAEMLRAEVVRTVTAGTVDGHQR